MFVSHESREDLYQGSCVQGVWQGKDCLLRIGPTVPSHAEKVILINFRDGQTRKLEPFSESDFRILDDPDIQGTISRVSIIDARGSRIDLPRINEKFSRVWLEPIFNSNMLKGVRVCLRIDKHKTLSACHFYSDGRVVLDVK